MRSRRLYRFQQDFCEFSRSEKLEWMGSHIFRIFLFLISGLMFIGWIYSIMVFWNRSVENRLMMIWLLVGLWGVIYFLYSIYIFLSFLMTPITIRMNPYWKQMNTKTDQIDKALTIHWNRFIRWITRESSDFQPTIVSSYKDKEKQTYGMFNLLSCRARYILDGFTKPLLYKWNGNQHKILPSLSSQGFDNFLLELISTDLHEHLHWILWQDATITGNHEWHINHLEHFLLSAIYGECLPPKGYQRYMKDTKAGIQIAGITTDFDGDLWIEYIEDGYRSILPIPVTCFDDILDVLEDKSPTPRQIALNQLKEVKIK